MDHSKKSATFKLQDALHHDIDTHANRKPRPSTPSPAKGKSKSSSDVKRAAAGANKTIISGSKSSSSPVNPSYVHTLMHAQPKNIPTTQLHVQSALKSKPTPTSSSKPKVTFSLYKVNPLAPDNSLLKQPKLKLAVWNGEVFVPTRTRPIPPSVSFIATNDLGPPGAVRRWIVDMKGFREDEITFFMDGPLTLKVEGKQNTRKGRVSYKSESINLPPSYDIEKLKVYRNKQIGTLVVAYLPAIE